MSTELASVKLLEQLESFGCCRRCILRFLSDENLLEPCTRPGKVLGCISTNSQGHSGICFSGEKKVNDEDHDIEGNPKKVPRTNDDIDIRDNWTTSDQEVCMSCLGLLQEKTVADQVEQIYEAVKKSDYEFHSVSLSVSSPLALMVMQHSMLASISVESRAALTENICSVKDVYKELICQQLETKLKSFHSFQSPFEVEITLLHHESEHIVKDICRGSAVTSSLITHILSDISVQEFLKYCPRPPMAYKTACSVSKVRCHHLPVFVAGRYCKYSRSISQTPWLLDGVRKGHASVQEIICPRIQDRWKADSVRFSSSGREDIDVRMLGQGRPFVVELINPHRSFVPLTDFEKLQQEINSDTSDVSVRDLQLVGRESTKHLKEGEEMKKKTYCALVKVEKHVDQTDCNYLNSLKDIVLKQKTPLRVMHRERIVYQVSSSLVDSHHIRLCLVSQAGTYVKEFVHGDMGRTVPSVRTLLQTSAEVIALDVASVETDWPPVVAEM
ncbi:tRNA pseudouridine synthase Pus10-like isoform X2 [Corticium candelabrum]|uniref:tRNA pseudouridine synthase Pus10-like isoform X2 n=1 Tax=Corticium candelabrum TaxID=121492 RepID=UPI002E255990|nr:tRNA pseudouridine synthase Pus10-like isoform X2 [Corticium candelabrum]